MRNCPNCNNGFSNWRLFFAQPWSPSFACPHCKTDLTYSFLKKGRKSGIIAGAIVVLFASELLPVVLVATSIGMVLIYEYLILSNTEILIFGDREKEEYEKRIYVNPKLGPITAFIAIITGLILILFGLASMYLVEGSSNNVYFLPVVIILSGIVGLWVGVKINSNNRVLSNKSLKNGTPKSGAP